MAQTRLLKPASFVPSSTHQLADEPQDFVIWVKGACLRLVGCGEPSHSQFTIHQGALAKC